MRGKHGQAAAVRHEVQSANAEISTYQHRVAKLTAELKHAREQLRTEELRNRRAERELRARLDAAASPKIEALESLLATARDERDDARRAYKHLREDLAPGMIRLFIDVMRDNGVPERLADLVLADLTTRNRQTPVEKIARRKGMRSWGPQTTPDVQW